MFFISRKRFEEEIDMRVREEVKLIEERLWYEEKEREHHREMQELSKRLNIIEQALSIEVPDEMNRIGFQ